MNKYNTQKGSKVAPDQFKIIIAETGPYLVFGRPPMNQQFIMQDEENVSWTFRAGSEFTTEKEPTALCRCGASKQKPYCDGSHLHHEWDPKLTAPVESIFDGAETLKGVRLTLTDNEKYCASARFCLAKGEIWNLIQKKDDQSAEYAVHEANHCPTARLTAWNPETGEPFEPELPVALGLIEDPQKRCSGGIFVTGGIPVSKEDGTTYEVRNRVVLCRCGQSKNKPFCDGEHIPARFKDELSGNPTGKEW